MTNTKTLLAQMERVEAGTDFGFGPLSKEDAAFHNQWRPASGHPGGWRVVRGICPVEELNGPSGRLLLFASPASAKTRADKLNSSKLNL
jgi:hypothetical protein